MSEPKYYVLACSEDGDVSLRTFTKAELESCIADEEIDPSEARIPEGAIYDFSSGYCPLVIIKGEAIKPTPVKVVSTWKV